MKRFMSLMLVVAMLFTLCSCGKKDPIEDEELVSKLESAIQSETVTFFLFKGVSLWLPTIHELEEIEEEKYNASGEIFVMKDGGDTEYVAFTAIMIVGDNDEVEFESLELDK